MFEIFERPLFLTLLSFLLYFFRSQKKRKKRTDRDRLDYNRSISGSLRQDVNSVDKLFSPRFTPLNFFSPETDSGTKLFLLKVYSVFSHVTELNFSFRLIKFYKNSRFFLVFLHSSVEL